MLHAFDFYTENAAKALSIEGLTELGQHCPDSEELILTGSFELSLLGSADQVLFQNLAKLWLWELERLITLPRISMQQHCTITLLNWTSFRVSIFAETRENLSRLL